MESIQARWGVLVVLLILMIIFIIINISSDIMTWQVILFSDILTPLPGMNIPFDIIKGKGPLIYNPLRTAAEVEQVRVFNPEESVPYVGEALRILRAEVSLNSNKTKLAFGF